MKTSIFLLTILAGFASAKGPTTRIEVKSAGLSRPIEITDPEVLAGFNVWAGPGTSSDEPQSLIVDWKKGIVAEPRYEVSFSAKFPAERVVYVVTYCYDAAAGRGYVYLPGKGEPRYSVNVSSILRFNEGNWFVAWARWDKVIRPRLTERVQGDPRGPGGPPHESR